MTQRLRHYFVLDLMGVLTSAAPVLAAAAACCGTSTGQMSSWLAVRLLRCRPIAPPGRCPSAPHYSCTTLLMYSSSLMQRNLRQHHHNKPASERRLDSCITSSTHTTAAPCTLRTPSSHQLLLAYAAAIGGKSWRVLPEGIPRQRLGPVSLRPGPKRRAAEGATGCTLAYRTCSSFAPPCHPTFSCIVSVCTVKPTESVG